LIKLNEFSMEVGFTGTDENSLGRSEEKIGKLNPYILVTFAETLYREITNVKYFTV